MRKFKLYIFTVFFLGGCNFFSFCMINKDEQKLSKLSRGKKVLHSFLCTYNGIQKDKEKALSEAVDNIWRISSRFAICKKKELGSASGLFLAPLINFEVIEKEQEVKEIKNIIDKILKVRIKKENYKHQVKEEVYAINDSFFKKKLSKVDEKTIKKILWLGVEIAQTEGGKDFKDMLSKVLRWGFGWLKYPICWILVKNSDGIEADIDKIIDEPFEFKNTG